MDERLEAPGDEPKLGAASETFSVPQQNKVSAQLELVIASDGHDDGPGARLMDRLSISSTPSSSAGSPATQKSPSSVSPGAQQNAAEKFRCTSPDRGRGQAPPLNTPSMFGNNKQRSPRRKAPF